MLSEIRLSDCLTGIVQQSECLTGIVQQSDCQNFRLFEGVRSSDTVILGQSDCYSGIQQSDCQTDQPDCRLVVRLISHTVRLGYAAVGLSCWVSYTVRLGYASVTLSNWSMAVRLSDEAAVRLSDGAAVRLGRTVGH
jgi:hypothetical protein